MYEGAITQVKSSVGLTDKIPVSVGIHQRFFLIPYISPIIMDVSACRIKDLSPRCMLHADNIVLCGTRREEVEKKLEEWRKGYGRQRAEDQYRKETVYLRFNGDGNLDGNSDINLQAEN